MNALKPNKLKYIIPFLLFAIFLGFVAFIPTESHPGDMGHWARWTGFILEEGFVNIYDYGLIYPTDFACNYPPVLLYFFKVYSFFVPDMEAIRASIKYFKVIPLFFDFIGIASIFLIIKPSIKKLWIPLLLLLNPAYWYNSYCWGQVDTIITVFIVLALISAVKKHWILAIIFYVIALNTKMQAIVFLPVFLLAIFPLLASWKRLFTGISLAVFIQLLLLLPFLLNGTAGDWLTVMGSLVDQYKNVSLNAFNFWYLVIDGEGALYAKDYRLFWWGLTYKTWGLSLFCISAFFALFPIFLKSLRHFLDPNKTNLPGPLVFLSAYLCVLVFFFFNTQMHERYAHPAMLLAFLYGVWRKDYWLYLLASAAYFFNMERVLKFFDMHYHTLVFQYRFIAALFLLAILFGFWRLYRQYPIRKDWNFICKYLRC